MCWTGYTSHKRIADKDIPCKKVIGYDNNIGVYKAWFIPKVCYSIGHLYTSELSVKVRAFPDALPPKGDLEIEITKGLHCYADSLRVARHDSIFRHGLAIGNFLIYESYDKPDTITLVDCIIPKGATYYENGRGEIVTDKLKLVKIHKL